MGVDVWAAVGVGKWQEVSSGSLFLRPQAQKADSPKDPAGPDACLCQQEEALRGLSQSHPAPHLPITQGVCCVTPIPTPRAQCGKWAQGQSMRQTDTPVGERKSAGVSRGDRQAPPHRANKLERRELERKVKTLLNSPSPTTSSNKPDGLQKTPILVFIPL